MAEKETVVVENGERRTRSGWAIVLIALILIALFFMFGGFNMFGSPEAGTNITTPTTTAPPTGTGQ